MPEQVIIYDGENSGVYTISAFDDSNPCDNGDNYIKIDGTFKNHTAPELFEKFSVINTIGVHYTPSMTLVETISL